RRFELAQIMLSRNQLLKDHHIELARDTIILGFEHASPSSGFSATDSTSLPCPGPLFKRSPERGLLLLLRGDAVQLEADATTARDGVEVRLRHTGVTPSALPESILHYVLRTQESVILDDASGEHLFSSDAYLRQHHPRSVLCLPLVKQAQPLGVLYLENTLA